MRTKKILTTLLLCLVLIGVFVGCKPTENDDSIDISAIADRLGLDNESLTVVNDMSAYDTLNKVVATYRKDNSYRRTEFFKFWTSPNVATQESYFEVYRDGDKMLSRNTKIGTKFGEANDLETFYFDGNDYYYSLVKDKKKVPGGKAEQSGTIDYFKVKNYGTITKQTENLDTMKEKQVRDTSHVFTYDLSDKAYLSSSHNDKVYKDKNGVYYFVITIDSSKERMDGVQVAARDEFYENTGAVKGSLEMLIDTTVTFTAKEINGELRITNWLRHEKYVGKQAGGLLKVTCEQTCHSTFSYDKADCVINESVIKSKLA